MLKSIMDDANEVGDAFATQYYNILQSFPKKLCKFYKDDSTIVRPGGNGTLSDMEENLNMLSSKGFDSAEVTCVISQDSQYKNKRCILVLVDGYFSSNEGFKKSFTQTFTLALQGKTYFVCVDMFSFCEKPEAKLPPEMVGGTFALQYYYYMQESPKDLICFYKDESMIARPGHNGTMLFSTLSDQDRDENLDMLSSRGFVSVKKTSVMSQDSLSGSVLVIVSGYFTLHDDLQRSFTQIFFLAPQEIGYFILNDILLFVENLEAREVVDEKVPETEVIRREVADDVRKDGPKISDASVVIPIGHGEHTSCDSSQEMKCDAVANIKNGNNQESQELQPGYRKTEVTRDKDADDSLRVSEPNDRLEDSSKMSYASALKNATPLPRGQGEHSSGYSSPQIKADAVDDTRRDGNNKECEALYETSTIYITNLPSQNTNSWVKKEFEKFGPIKNIAIQSPRTGYYYGFVEFRDAKAAEDAIKESPVVFERQRIYVERKLVRGGRRR